MTRKRRVTLFIASALAAVAVALAVWRPWDDYRPDPPSAAASAGVALWGQVTDAHGRALKGARVTARARIRMTGEDTLTDAAGHWRVEVPFADVWYSVTAEYGGGSETRDVLPYGREVNFALAVASPTTVSGTVVDAASGAPVKGADVEVGMPNGVTFKAVSGEGGKFTVKDVPDYVELGEVFARYGDKVSQVTPARKNGAEVLLQLDAPASVKGVVRHSGTKKPIPGAVVIFHSRPSNGFQFTATAGPDGTYEIAGMPSGLYRWMPVEAKGCSSWTIMDNESFPGLYEGEFQFYPGMETRLDTDLLKAAAIYGRVVSRTGAPVEGALVEFAHVHTVSRIGADKRALTDSKGRFFIYSPAQVKPPVPFWEAMKRLVKRAKTGTAGQQSATITAFSSQAGAGDTPLYGLREGEVRKSVVIRLNGAARVRGVVTDGKGAPLPDICVYDPPRYWTVAKTDAQGRFDLGRVPLGPDGGVTFVLRAARPDRSIGFDDDGKFVIEPDTTDYASTRWFHYGNVSVKDPPTDEVELKVALDEARLLTFSGAVFDEAGRPASGAVVLLFPGNAGPAGWNSCIHMDMSRSGNTMPDTPIGRTRADDKGRWTIKALPP